MSKPKHLVITQVKYVGGHSLCVKFSDGKTQTTDFGPFLRSSYHPDIRKYLKPGYFKRFIIKDGDLMWGDYDLIFPIMDLYNNCVSPEGSKFTKAG